jgi:hypothetical protein
MSADEKSIINLIKAGKMNLQELRQTFAAESTGNVSVQDWGVCYSSGTGQLSQYCTVVANNSNDPITGVGMLAYTSDGSSLLCLQYSNGFSSPYVATSIGTTLYNPQQGNQMLCVVYGFSSSFYFMKTLTIEPCQ